MAIRFFDMFAGIGGFRSGLEAVGGFECIGHCEIDKRTNMAYCAIYDTEGEYYCDDARTINPDEMPDFDLLCAGFPCQSFSVAGKRLGFEDTRGTLFFEVARLLAAKRPAFFLLENVPGLLSHDGGKTLETIYAALIEMGYHFEWCVHNSRYFGVPQQRRRLYIVGYLDPRCAGQIFPLSGGNAAHLRQLIGGAQGQRVYDPNGVACTQAATSGGWGGKTGLYFIDMNADPVVTRSYHSMTPMVLDSIKYTGDKRYLNVIVNNPLEAIESIFRTILPEYGFTVREDQIKLSQDMYLGLTGKQVAICEAEVGTGKTLAYLIASFVAKERYAAEYGFNLPVTISTSSIELQKMIVEKEVPQLSRMLQDYGLIKHPLCAVVRKGKEHYFCKARYYDYLNKIMDHKEKYRNMIDYFTANKIAVRAFDLDMWDIPAAINTVV